MPRHSRHNTVLSDDDDDEELVEMPQPKRRCRSRDHISDIELFDERTRGQRGHRRPSSKQASNERDAAEEQIRKLTRQLAKAKRDVARERNAFQDEDENSLESQDDEDMAPWTVSTQPIATFALDEDQPRRPYIKRGTKRTPPVPTYTRAGSSSTHTTTTNTLGPQGDTPSAFRALPSIVSSPATHEPAQSISPQGQSSETEGAEPNPPTRQTNPASNDVRDDDVTEVNNAPDNVSHANPERQTDMSAPRPPTVETQQAAGTPKKVLTPKFKAGQKPSGTLKAGDYEDAVRAAIISAIRYYEAEIMTRNAYACDADRVRWASEAWQYVFEKADAMYELTSAISGLIKGRDPQARKFVKDAAREGVKTYGFSDDKTAAENKEIYERIKNGFHYKDPVEQHGYGENHAIIRTMRLAWFTRSEKTNIAVKFPSFFKPVPLPALAIIFTMVEFAIDEWSTGEFKPEDLSQDVQCELYRAHLAKLREWASLNEQFSTNRRKKLFDKCM
ncbi:uncharacterized protein STEHIDRAFT_116342 [Stereum hirsutum FP-91666 SS1]|uniref:DUF6532 domain-containing protein n=1 Tax=Stereum hirsutum (strain FP-91666) TaxID=721885 RepID=R7RZ84_STEHR|nr:uncharacterized protein STEHIDRAFT_116342 [Stereum hirsutum FP-91666 SS1]EIM79627.1 hypothetical protein STEHIDRAFT_116342 [Stereum hirsutum FP-91666 SS1]